MTTRAYTQFEPRLRAAGIPWRDARAVFNCAKKIKSGEAYLVASEYLRELRRGETYPNACRMLDGGSLYLYDMYRRCAHEAR